MVFGKSEEEKAADEAEKAAHRAADEQNAAAAAKRKEQADFLRHPIGQAWTAKQQNQGFFEVQLVVGESQRNSSIFNPDPNGYGLNRTASHAGTLAAIESIGWHLEHAGYVFLITGESSSDKLFATGENTAVSGQTVGVYLFRNTDPGATPAA
jgi:hypothetical protein